MKPVRKLRFFAFKGNILAGSLGARWLRICLAFGLKGNSVSLGVGPS